MNKTKRYGVMLAVGCMLLLIGGLFFRADTYRTVNGLVSGIGAGAIGVGFSGVIMQLFLRKHPEKVKKSDIEFHDERNRAIRLEAKAKCSDVYHWGLMGAAWISILLSAPLWITFTLLGLFLARDVLMYYFMFRLNKEM